MCRALWVVILNGNGYVQSELCFPTRGHISLANNQKRYRAIPLLNQATISTNFYVSLIELSDCLS